MKLNNIEQSIYNIKFVEAVKTLSPGTYFIKDFFGPDPSVPRISGKSTRMLLVAYIQMFLLLTSVQVRDMLFHKI